MYAFLAAKAGKQKFAKLGALLGLTADEFAMVYLCAHCPRPCTISAPGLTSPPPPPRYSMECGFYKRLNTELRDRNRALLVQAFFPALRLLLSAINKLGEWRGEAAHKLGIQKVNSANDTIVCVRDSLDFARDLEIRARARRL
jgi:hypothetical protein